jgi:hypothetical protein
MIMTPDSAQGGPDIVTLDSARGEPDFTFVHEYSQREDKEKDLVLHAVGEYTAPGRIYINDYFNSRSSLYIDGTFYMNVGVGGEANEISNWSILENMDSSWDRKVRDTIVRGVRQDERFMEKTMRRGSMEVKFSIMENNCGDIVWDIRDSKKELPVQPVDIISILKEAYDAYGYSEASVTAAEIARDISPMR